MPSATRLVINADDFGYSPQINRGILHCAARGRVTATGVMANSALTAQDFGDLRGAGLSLGVHLNLSHGAPLSSSMRALFGSRFPSKFAMTARIAAGVVRETAVEAELEAQIEQCRRHGLSLTFLNSHEHLHMLPSVARVVSRLARKFEIPFIRVTQTDPLRSFKPGALFRDAAISLSGALSARCWPAQRKLRFLGLSRSGALTTDYLERLLSQVPRGSLCELMCHPGFNAAEELADSSLSAYHRWEGELDALCGEELARVLSEHDVELVKYEDLLA